MSYEDMKATIVSLHEINPMLGHRGCRLSITYPEICDMQARAIFEAAAELVKEGKAVMPEVDVYKRQLLLQKHATFIMNWGRNGLKDYLTR